MFRAPPPCDHKDWAIYLFEPELKDAYAYKRCHDCGAVYICRLPDYCGTLSQWANTDRGDV